MKAIYVDPKQFDLNQIELMSAHLDQLESQKQQVLDHSENFPLSGRRAWLHIRLDLLGYRYFEEALTICF